MWELRAKLSVLEFARECAALAKEYNGALLAVERNNLAPAASY